MDINSFTNIKSPVFLSESGFYINLTCDIDGVGVGIIFTAFDADPEPYGHQLYAAAMAGTYGTVAPYVAPVIPPETPETPEKLLSKNTSEQGRLLKEISISAFALQSAVDLNVATAEQQQKLIKIKKYASALLNVDLTKSPIVWPPLP